MLKYHNIVFRRKDTVIQVYLRAFYRIISRDLSGHLSLKQNEAAVRVFPKKKKSARTIFERPDKATSKNQLNRFIKTNLVIIRRKTTSKTLQIQQLSIFSTFALYFHSPFNFLVYRVCQINLLFFKNLCYKQLNQ